MARADSTVRVNVVGDARSLQKAAKDSEKAAGRISSGMKVAGGIIAGAFAVSAVTDFAQTALNESDRIGDAVTRLEAQLGDLSQPLIDAAGGMEKLGQSRQDVLELEARFTDLAKAAHLSNDEIAASAQPVSEAAAALALLGIGGGDAATVLDLIGKAAGGGAKPLKELGISLSDTAVETRALAMTGKDNVDALTDQELAAARLALIMEALQPRITAVTEGEADLEQKQLELSARFETFTGQVGGAVEGPLTDLLTMLIALGEELGRDTAAIKSLDPVLDQMEGGFADAADALRDLLALLAQLAAFTGRGGVLGFASGTFGTSVTTGGVKGPPHPGIVVQVTGGSPEVIERSVQNAITSLTGKGPTSGSGV